MMMIAVRIGGSMSLGLRRRTVFDAWGGGGGGLLLSPRRGWSMEGYGFRGAFFRWRRRRWRMEGVIWKVEVLNVVMKDGGITWGRSA
jgi:hypothetical protein